MKKMYIKRMVGTKFRYCFLVIMFIAQPAFSQEVDTTFVSFHLKSKIISSIFSTDFDEGAFNSNINRHIYFEMDPVGGKYENLYFITVKCGESLYSDSSFNEYLSISGNYHFFYNPIAERVYNIASSRWKETLYLLRDLGIYSKSQINHGEMLGIFSVLDLMDFVKLSQKAELQLKRKHKEMSSTFEFYRIEVQ